MWFIGFLYILYYALAVDVSSTVSLNWAVNNQGAEGTAHHQAEGLWMGPEKWIEIEAVEHSARSCRCLQMVEWVGLFSLRPSSIL